MRIAPDINDPYPRPSRSKPGNGGGGANNNLVFAAFAPGQLAGLAADLNAGFGGGFGDWKDHLRDTSNTSRIGNFHYGNGGGGGGHNNGGNGGNNNGGNSPNGSGQDHNNGGFNPSRPRSMAMPIGGGLLGPQVQMQQQQPQRGLLGDIPPEVLAFIRSGGMR